MRRTSSTPGRMRHPQIEHDQIELVEVGAHVGEQLRHALDDHRAVSRRIERALETIAHERRVSGDQNVLRVADGDVISRV